MRCPENKTRLCHWAPGSDTIATVPISAFYLCECPVIRLISHALTVMYFLILASQYSKCMYEQPIDCNSEGSSQKLPSTFHILTHMLANMSISYNNLVLKSVLILAHFGLL